MQLATGTATQSTCPHNLDWDVTNIKGLEGVDISDGCLTDHTNEEGEELPLEVTLTKIAPKMMPCTRQAAILSHRVKRLLYNCNEVSFCDEVRSR